MTRYIKQSILVLLICLCQTVWAQIYPVQAVSTVYSPYSSKISDYSNPLVNRVNLQLITTDLAVQNRQVQLFLKIQGNGITAQSAAVLSGTLPIYISGGEITNLTSNELSSYFRFQNLQGLSTTQYSEPLPDGVYTICFQVYDLVTRKWLSQNSCATMYLMLNDPPQLNLPANNEQIASTTFPNINFSWTPRHLNATNVSYTFEIKEILNPTLDPAFTFETSNLLYKEEDLRTTNLLYDLSKPTLIPGKKYAWRVKAISTNGLAENNVFKNNGYSQINYFTYASTCEAPRYLLSEQQGSNRVKIMWDGINTQQRYHIQYKKANTPNAEWFDTYTVNTQTLLTNLEPGYTYEFRVGATCEPTQYGITQSYIYSGIQTFAINKNDKATAYNCGIVPTIEIRNQQPLGAMVTNETFMAGDFPVKVLDVQGGNGMFSGSGYIQVPYLADTRIGVTFNNIRINADYQMLDGVVETTYDPNWGNVENVNDFINDLKKIWEELDKLYADLISGNFDDKTSGEKDTIIKNYNGILDNYNPVIDDLVNDGTLTTEQAEDLKNRVETAKDCFEQGINCTPTIVEEPSPNSGPSPSFFYYYDDCTNAREACQQALEKLKDEIENLKANSYNNNSIDTFFATSDLQSLSVGKGIDPSGKIITSITKDGKIIVPAISQKYNYIITGFFVYDNSKNLEAHYIAKYNANGEFESYVNVNNSFEKLSDVANITYESSGRVNTYKLLSDKNCFFYEKTIEWTSENQKINVYKLIDNLNDYWEKEKIERRQILFDPDPSCTIINSLASLIDGDKDKKSICTTQKIENDKKILQETLFSKSSFTTNEIVNAIVKNNVCLDALSSFTYKELIKAFKQIGLAENIYDDEEIALLRLMSAIKSTDYVSFIRDLEDENNELLLNITSKLQDKILYVYGENNFTSFIGGLVHIYNHKNNTHVWRERLKTVDDIELFGQVISLDPIKFELPKAEGFFEFFAQSHIKAAGQSKFSGKLVDNNIIISRESLYYNNLGGMWLPDSNYPSIKLKPLDPVTILSTENLDIVKTALDGVNTNPIGMYIVPAIFLEYKSAKEFNDAVEKSIINTLDVVTIATSGGTALVTKVHWVKRAWAITELVGAVGNLVVTNTDLKKTYPITAATIDTYNAVMGLIGLKNAAVGLKNVPAAISSSVKKVVLQGKKLNQAEDIVQTVTKYKTELTTLKKSPEWHSLSPENQQLILKQEAFIDVLMEVKVVNTAGKLNFSSLIKTNLSKLGVSDDIAKYSLAPNSRGGAYILQGVIVDAKEIALADEIFSLTNQRSIFPKNNLQAIEGFLENGTPFTMKELESNFNSFAKRINEMSSKIKMDPDFQWIESEGYLKIPFNNFTKSDGTIQTVTRQYVEQLFNASIGRNAFTIKNDGTVKNITVFLQDGSNFKLDLTKLKS